MFARLKTRLDSNFEGLFEARDGTTFAVFRFLFGVLMAGEAFFHYWGDVDRWYSPDDFHFTYSFFHWVAPLPGSGMHIVIVVMGIAAIGIALGLFYRVCCVVFTLIYTYIFLIEAATYNNHYYLIILLGLLFSVTNAHSALSLDRLRGDSKLTGVIPLWHVAIFRAQMIIVYFFGGVAKLNWDWLRGEPARLWITGRGPMPLIDPLIGDHFVREEWIVIMVSYGGLLFDLLIGFALLHPVARLAAIPFLLFFHGTNMTIFEIGVFPPLAVCSTLLFFPGDMPRRLFNRLGYVMPQPEKIGFVLPGRRRLVCAGLVVYMGIQILMPFRHWLYPGNVSWTEEGHLLAWHMKLRSKPADAIFYVKDADGTLIATLREPHQLRDMHAEKRHRMLKRPQLVVQYAHLIRDRYAEKGVEAPQVYVDLTASLNGRPYRPLIDPDVDLAQAHYSPIWPAQWILPLEDDLPIGLYR